MPRNRMVKSTFWVEEAVVSCSRDARLLYIGMWNFCDDDGIHPVSYLTLKMEVFPGDNCSVDDIKKWINELIEYKLIREYAAKDKLYWIVPDWENRQTINRPTPSNYPKPESGYKQIPHSPNFIEHSVSNHTVLNDGSLNTHGGLIPNINKDKRKEDKEDIREVETSLCAISETSSSTNEVQEIFSYWQQALDHPKAKLDSKRQRAIKQALKTGYTVGQLKQAIDGCAKSSFHMGQNEHNKRFDDISLILRDASHIEGFISDITNPSVPVTQSTYNSNVMAGVGHE